jgi:hypothetical protein
MNSASFLAIFLLFLTLGIGLTLLMHAIALLG